MSSMVTLPNPWEDAENFGRRVSRWARPEAGSVGPAGGGGTSGLTFDGDRILKVSLGFWNNIAQPRHMEMILDVDGLPSNIETQPEEGIIGATDKKRCVWPSGKKKTLWTLNAYMGGDNMVVLKAGKAETFSTSNKAANAPLALDIDVSRRPWSVRGMVVEKHVLESYYMKASTFVLMLRRFLRWGFAVGSSQKFRFNPLLFIHKDPKSKISGQTDEDLHFISCQASIAMLAKWWMLEALKEISPSSPLSEEMEDTISNMLARKIAPHILIKPHKFLFLWWMKRVRKQAEERILNMLSSESVQEAIRMDDDTADGIITEYHEKKRKKTEPPPQEGNDDTEAVPTTP